MEAGSSRELSYHLNPNYPKVELYKCMKDSRRILVCVALGQLQDTLICFHTASLTPSVLTPVDRVKV